MGVADDPYRETIAGWSSRPCALSIPEELLLLQEAVWGGLGERARAFVLPVLAKPLAAARLIELILAKRVMVGRANRLLLRHDAVLVIDAAPTGDALLDDDLERIAASKPRSYSYWTDHPARGSEAACWDRLVAKSLIRPGDLSDAPTYLADANAVAATRARIRAVLDGPETAELRDVALVALLAHSKNLDALLDETKRSPAGLARRYAARRREEKLGRQAIDKHKRFVESAPELDEDQRQWTIEAANSIAWIAHDTTPDGWFEGG